MKHLKHLKLIFAAFLLTMFYSFASFAGSYSINYCEWSAEEERDIALWSRTEQSTSFKVGLFKSSGTQVGSWHTTYDTMYDFTSAIENSGSGTYYFKVYPVEGGKSYTIQSEKRKVEFAYDYYYDYYDYEIDDCYWKTSGGRQVAKWDKALDKTSYKVALYKSGGGQVGSWHTTDGTSYDFTSAIQEKGSGSYYFKVYPKKGGESYKIKSDTIHVSVSQSSSSGSSRTAAKAEWVHSPSGSWYYQFANGDYAVNCWQYINNHWYYFGSDQVMKTGWQEIGGKWYYLEPAGTSLHPQGACYMNCTTPDGRVVGADGAWTGQMAGQTAAPAASTWYTMDTNANVLHVVLPISDPGGFNVSIANPSVAAFRSSEINQGFQHLSFEPTWAQFGGTTITLQSSSAVHVVEVWVMENGVMSVTAAK